MTDLNKARSLSLRLWNATGLLYEEAADTIDALVAEVERLTKVDAAKRLTNLRFLGLTNSAKGDGNES